MVFELVIPNEATGDVSQASAEMTEHLIRRLFEKAIGNALRLSLEPSEWTVKQGRRLRWPVENASHGIVDILPGMQTDIELIHVPSGRQIVIDTKFTEIFTSSNYRSKMLKNGYLYQLYAYLRTQEGGRQPDSGLSEGMLLHPQIGASVDEYMELQGHRMRFRTIDLTATPPVFEEALCRLIA
jgi:5-methylcytosine-specific restriction enzyme subunit McrC